MNNPGQGDIPYNTDICLYSAAGSSSQTTTQGHSHWQGQFATQPDASQYPTEADDIPGLGASAQIRYHAGPSHSSQISSIDPLPSSQYIPQFTSSQLHDPGRLIQPPPQPYADPRLQLELLREMRKIRELEFSIALEKRRADEAIMRQREAELALADLDRYTDYTHVDDSRSTTSLQQPDALLSDSWPFASHPALVEPPLSAAGSSSNQDVSSLDASPDFRPTSVSRSLYRQQDLSPSIGLSSSNVSTSTEPRQSKSKRTVSVFEEQEIHCSSCSRLMAKALLRGTRSELDVRYQPQFHCNDCMDPDGQSTLSGVSSRKRGYELEDTTVTTLCVICSRGQGQGGFVSKDREPLQFTYDVGRHTASDQFKVVFTDITFRLSVFPARRSTNGNYGALGSIPNPYMSGHFCRCSNCSGATNRVVTGKWRCKEMFVEGRKTCCLSHDRSGSLFISVILAL